VIDRNQDGSPIPAPFFTDSEPCEACGKPTDERISDGDLMICADCFEEFIAQEYAERTCPTLHDAIIRSKSIGEVRKTMQGHKARCSVCGLRVVASRPVNSLAAPEPPAKEAA
jgi:hypothetical protein